MDGLEDGMTAAGLPSEPCGLGASSRGQGKLGTEGAAWVSVEQQAGALLPAGGALSCRALGTQPFHHRESHQLQTPGKVGAWAWRSGGSLAGCVPQQAGPSPHTALMYHGQKCHRVPVLASRFCNSPIFRLFVFLFSVNDSSKVYMSLY